MRIIVIGLNHKTADVELREKLAFSGPKLDEGIDRIRELPPVHEAVIISTCNRVEMYLCVSDIANAYEAVKDFLSGFFHIDRESLDRALYLHEDLTAVRHAFRVASSLDSMVVGEPQILGQLKEAFDYSLARKATGILLNKLLKKSISVAKRVRTETRIAENAVSISYAAVELAKKIFTDLSDMSFMLLGAGEMAELAARHIISSGVRDIIVANRTFGRGCELAKEFGGRAIAFDSFHKELVHADIVICSTGAPSYVLAREEMHKVMKDRRQKPVFIIDISVPRNIDPGINELNNVYLYDVDDLQGVVDTNVLERKKEASKAEAIIEEEVETFRRWLSSLDSVPTVIALREKADAIKKEEMEKLINRMPHIGEKEKKAMEGMVNAVVNKLIHPPTAALKEDAEDKDVLIATIRKLYGLNGEDNEQQ